MSKDLLEMQYDIKYEVLFSVFMIKTRTNIYQWAQWVFITFKLTQIFVLVLVINSHNSINFQDFIFYLHLK